MVCVQLSPSYCVPKVGTELANRPLCSPHYRLESLADRLPPDELILSKAFNNVVTGLEAIYSILEQNLIASFVRSVSACPSMHMILYVARCLHECSLKDYCFYLLQGPVSQTWMA